MNTGQRPRKKQAFRHAHLLWLIGAILLTAVLTWWATATAFKSSADSSHQADTEDIWVTAATTEIGKTLDYHAAVVTPVAPVAVNQLSGTVTHVGGGQTSSGDVLYTVDNTNVYAVQGARPFYRSLESGAKGWDVKQLQESLRQSGQYRGAANGTFDAATVTALKTWQKSIGAPTTGKTKTGELVAIRSLPTTTKIDENIRLGTQLAGGETAVHAPAGQQRFELNVTAEQAKQIPQDAPLSLTYKKHRWPAVLGDSHETEGGVRFTLQAPEGGRVCGKECKVLPSNERFTIPASIEVVPRTTGVGIPLAAVETTADGKTQVRTDSGEVHVSVTATGEGIAIVDGLEAGTKVRIPQARNHE